MDDFLFHPERLVGYPLTLDEARQRLNRGRFTLKEWMTLSSSEVREGREQSQIYLWWKLASGDLHSFAQAGQSGAWYRLPSGYWVDHREGFAGLAKQVAYGVLGSLVEEKAYIGHTPPELVGAHILVWQADVDQLIAQMGAEGEAFEAFLGHVLSLGRHSGQVESSSEQAASVSHSSSTALEEEKRIAAILDAAGVPKRDVKGRVIAEHWSGLGPKPSVLNVQSLMAGQAGGRPAEKDTGN